MFKVKHIGVCDEPSEMCLEQRVRAAISINVDINIICLPINTGIHCQIKIKRMTGTEEHGNQHQMEGKVCFIFNVQVPSDTGQRIKKRYLFVAGKVSF